jgi:AraC-like DNA-binding protein
MVNLFGTGIIFNNSRGMLIPPIQFGDILLYQIGENIIERNGEIYEHTQECHEISLVVSGEADFYSNDEVHQLKKDSIHVIPKGINHTITVKNQSRFRYFYLGFDFATHKESTLTDKLSKFLKAGTMHGIDDGTIMQHFSNIIKEFQINDSFGYDMYSSYIKLILISVYRLFQKESVANHVSSVVTASSCGTVFNIIKYIDSNISTITKVSEIANNMNYSSAYISRIFKEKMEMTIQEYIRCKKIEESMILLKTKRFSINEVAEHLNFNSYRMFFNSFKKHVGCSPSDFVKNECK